MKNLLHTIYFYGNSENNKNNSPCCRSSRSRACCICDNETKLSNQKKIKEPHRLLIKDIRQISLTDVSI